MVRTKHIAVLTQETSQFLLLLLVWHRAFPPLQRSATCSAPARNLFFLWLGETPTPLASVRSPDAHGLLFRSASPTGGRSMGLIQLEVICPWSTGTRVSSSLTTIGPGGRPAGLIQLSINRLILIRPRSAPDSPLPLLGWSVPIFSLARSFKGWSWLSRS